MNAGMTVTLQHYLFVSALLFVCGLYAVMTRRNSVWVLMGIEMILNAASLNFAAFSRFVPPAPGAPAEAGMIASIIIIVLAAAEAAVALGILLGIYRNFRTIDTTDLKELQG
jgi:NADH-quinone oxidoreductase subunit K